MENRILSKILNDKDISPVFKGNLTENDFPLQSKTLSFIMNYTKMYGQVPSVESVVAECPTFEYVGEVPDNFKYLIKGIKNASAKRMAYEMLQFDAGDKYSKLEGVDMLKWIADTATHALKVVHAETEIGTNFAVNGKERAESYKERKENRSGRFIPTPYPSLNEWLGGGGELGDYMLINAYTNRGKSWIAGDFGIHAWRNKFGVLHYSPELSKSQQMDRLDTLNGHFNNIELKTGHLGNEEKFMDYLATFNESNEVPYLVKTMDDLTSGLSLEVIEADLQSNPNVKMVIIDGFNLMSHKGKGGGSNRDAMSSSSRALRQLFGKYKVLGIVVHHTPTSAEKENQEKDEAGIRIVKPPEIYQYSETVAVIQDACTVLTFDQFQGVGKLKLAKARTPFVGNEIELHCDFNLGFIREVTPVDFF